ncbi:MAG: esterase/lipase family protein [Rubrivivax sp.]
MSASASHTAAARGLMTQASARLATLNLAANGPSGSGLPSVQSMRRRRTASVAGDTGAGFLTLVRDEDGTYDWRVDAGPSPGPQAMPRRATRRGGRLFEAEPIDQALFTPVQGSQVTQALDALDGNFNPRYGLFDLAGKRIDAVAATGRILLIVHGTFSNSDAITGPFAPLLAQAKAAGYDQIMVFEHPTLAVSPFLNALDLARAFEGSKAQVDVVAHSRGGLVVRWWLEVLDRAAGQRARVVFFGSPLMGTGLASPYRLRAALKLLTNVAVAAQGTAQLAALAVPLFTVVQGLMTLLASGTRLLASTPLPDAAVALVPGLAAMSRYGPDASAFVQGNHELSKLGFGLPVAPAGYHAVLSNFEPTDEGWKFWRLFRNAKERVGDVAADVIFAGENDLVVDTPSMTSLSPSVKLVDAARRLDFQTSSTVHHLNYFHQPESAAFVRQVFGF